MNARTSNSEAVSDAMEMAVLSSVQHPNIVQVYACLTDMVAVEDRECLVLTRTVLACVHVCACFLLTACTTHMLGCPHTLHVAVSATDAAPASGGNLLPNGCHSHLAWPHSSPLPDRPVQRSFAPTPTDHDSMDSCPSLAASSVGHGSTRPRFRRLMPGELIEEFTPTYSIIVMEYCDRWGENSRAGAACPAWRRFAAATPDSGRAAGALGAALCRAALSVRAHEPHPPFLSARPRPGRNAR
mgnify:CR=1 FL=1